jgi:cyclic pyranopterin phosphate synthase
VIGATEESSTTPAPPLEQLVDGHGRRIGDVRISVTDRCNFRCQYCMPADGLPWLEREELLSYEEWARLIGLLGRMGIHDVRLTGGEPLVRRDLHKLLTLLAADPNVHDLSLTTNGYLLRRQLPDLVAAGLQRLNVSLDSLVRERFFELTRRDSLDEVLAGLEAAEAYPQLRPIKVNAVALRDFTEAEAIRFAELARRKIYEVRFIEWMPLDADQSWDPARVLPGKELREIIHAVYPLEPMGRPESGTSSRWRFADGRGTIGFISPVSEPFCGDCNRIRLTADGRLRTCLFSLHEHDLRAPLRDGADDEELERIMRDAVWRKELKHHISEPGFVRPPRSMSQIGG